ncbi:MAG: hypothetical protein HY926_09280 [Elusimicrobia bacterium]|nr:hypothetical protein [Elusimicrobiota bacterium]
MSHPPWSWKLASFSAGLILSGLLCVLPLELACRYWLRHFGDPAEKAKAILRLDAHLGWRQQADFHGTFLGIPLDTNAIGLRAPALRPAEASVCRLLVLGPSSTFGWGVPESETYAKLLEGFLRSRKGGPPVEVINAGEIGFSSWQGLEFYRRELRGIRPCLTVIAYGANDVDRYRFFFDSDAPDGSALREERAPAAVWLHNMTARLSLFQVLPRALLRLGGRFSCGEPDIRSLRVPPQDYAENLRQLVRQLRQDHSAVLLMTTASAMPAGPGAAQCEDYYRLSRSLAAARRCSEARKAFADARRSEPYRIEKDLRLYNRLVREVGEQESAAVLDAAVLLTPEKAGRVFLDPIHPSPLGHALIARALFKDIAGKGLLSAQLSSKEKNDAAAR